MSMDTPGALYGFAPPTLTGHTVKIPGWTGRLRVAHITDLHFGVVTPMAIQREAVAQVNAAKPQLTVLTGDFICRGRSFLDRMTETLSAIDGPKLAVLGNHDHWSDGPGVRAALERAEVEVLENAWTMFGVGEDALPIVGLDDYGTDHHDVDLATKGLGATPALALSHNPESAPLLWGRGGPKVVLSGHTHGGQLHVQGWTEAIWRKLVNVKYLSGFYTEEGFQVYVNPGVGASVVPWRYGRPAMRTVSVLNLEGG